MAQAPFDGRARLGAVTEPLLQFFHERLAVLLREQGSTAQEVDAVLGLKPAALAEVPHRLAAVRAFAGMPESASLAAANKRITNILKKSEVDGAGRVQPALFTEDAERALHGALQRRARRAPTRCSNGATTPPRCANWRR